MPFASSMNIIEKGCDVVAGGVNSNFRLGIPPTPLVFERAEGAYLVDVDGNRIIDYFLGMGPMLLGHDPAPVIAAAQQQLGRSLLVGGQTSLEYEAAQLLVDIVPSAERVRFCSSGSEADQAAVRLARAATARDVVVKFEGHYHGWFDNLMWSVGADLEAMGPRESPTLVPGSEGMMPAQGLAVLPWNDIDALRARLASGDVAAVLMEPIMFNSGGIMPLPGYLEAVRDACDDFGTLLIFDEVITGFRVAAGGAQDECGVTPDLTILGKALANGFAVAAVVGRADLMDMFSTGKVLHGGTYNTQSVSMAATVATLREIASNVPYQVIRPRGEALMEGLRGLFDKHGIEASVVGFPSVFHVRFGSVDARDYRESLAADRARYAAFAEAMLLRMVRILPRGTWFLSTEHGDAEIEATLAAADQALGEV